MARKYLKGATIGAIYRWAAWRAAQGSVKCNLSSLVKIPTANCPYCRRKVICRELTIDNKQIWICVACKHTLDPYRHTIEPIYVSLEPSTGNGYMSDHEDINQCIMSLSNDHQKIVWTLGTTPDTDEGVEAWKLYMKSMGLSWKKLRKICLKVQERLENKGIV